MDESIVKIQATISGYSGMPCSLLSAYYRDSGILVIVKIHAYSSEPIKDSSVITNVPRISRSAFFAESDMKKAIQAFKTLSGKIAEDGTRGIEFAAGAGRTNPSSILESNGIDVSGEKFKIAPEVTNEQVAVLATCCFVEHIEAADMGIGLIDDINDAYDRLVMGWYVTI